MKIEYTAYLVFGTMACAASLAVFSLGCHTGISPVSAHLLAAATSGLVLSYCMYRREHGAADQRTAAVWLCRTAVVFAVAATIQGALFQSLRGLEQFTDFAAFAPAVVGGSAVFLTMAVAYIYPGRSARDSKTDVPAVAAVLLVSATIFMRLVYLGLPELLEQEAYYWNYAQHPALSYLDHPPMVAALIWLGTKIFGVNEFGVRIGAFICWFITAYFSYRLTHGIFGKSAALGAVLLLAVLPFYFGVGFMMTPDAPLHAAWSALIYFSYRALIDNHSKAWFGIGVSFGLGLLSKYTIVLLGPAIVCFMLFEPRARRWFLRPEPYGALLLLLIIFSPVILWNIQHDWVSFIFQSGKRVAGAAVFTTHYLAGYTAVILTPAGLLAGVLFFAGGNKVFNSLRHQHVQGDNGPDARRAYFLFLLLILFPFLVFFVFSFTREIKLNWTSPVWLAAIPFMGCTTTSVIGRISHLGRVYRLSLSAIQVLWRITIPTLIIVFAVAIHYVTLGLPGLPPVPGPFLIGWDGLASDIERVVDEEEKVSGKRPVVVGMDHYQLTSGLTFYRTKNALKNMTSTTRVLDETVGWHVFGMNSRMYRYWSDPQKWEGRDIIAVASKKARLEKAFFKTDLVFKTEVTPLDAMKENRPVRRFYYRVISGD